MSSPYFEDDPRRFQLDVVCPDCRLRVAPKIVAGPVYRGSGTTDPYAYLICACPRIDQTLIFVIYDRMNHRVEQAFPFLQVAAAHYDDAIPGPVREDFAEAVRCLFTKAYRGVVVMCRRAMQQMMKEKGATKRDLNDQIDEIFSKGLIIAALQKAAHEVRHFGNFGSHPQDDGLDNITRDDAELVLKVTRDFMDALYVQPAEVEKLRQKRKPP